MSRRTRPAEIKVVAEGGGGTSGSGAEILLQPMVSQAVSLQHMEVTHSGTACEELQPVGGTHTEEIHGGLSRRTRGCGKDV